MCGGGELMKYLRKVTILPLIIIFVFSISTSGCFLPYDEDRVLVVSQISYAIPGARTGDNYAIHYEFLDADEYGRKLFAFSINTSLGIAAVCVLQKNDRKYVYYYDTVSYLMTEQFNQCTPEQLEALKVANDWNKAMDEEKMIKRELVNKTTLGPSRKSDLDRGMVQNIFYRSIDQDKNISTNAQYFDYSQTGQEIFFVSRDEEKKINGKSVWTNIDYYFMILNSDGTYDPQNYLIKLDDLNTSNAPLAEIKEKNGWKG